MYNTSSVAEAVRDALESDLLLFQMLQSGVANLTALAGKIKPNVEKRLGTTVSINTVVASLTRLAHFLENQGGFVEDDKLPFGARLSLSDHVTELESQIKDLGELTSLYEKLRKCAYIPFGLFITSDKWRLYIDNNSNQKDAHLQFLGELKSENRFTKIRVDFARQMLPLPNTLIYEISSMLYKSNTDIHCAFFTPSEIVLVVENDKAAKLYQMLSERLD